MSFTDALETRVLEWALTTGTPIRPTAWYVGLFTSAPDDTGGGTEVSGGSYVRMPATFTVSGNTGSNSTAAIEWPAATTVWGTVTHVAVFDAATSGTMLLYAALGTSKTFDIGDVPRIPLGDLDVLLN